MSSDAVALLGFAGLFLLIAARVPVGVALALVGTAGFASIAGIDPALNLLASSPLSAATDYSLGLIPMFILMGVVTSRSGMSGELFAAASAFLGHRKGGLAMATIATCGGFAAISGSSLATAATMSKIAVPEMRRHGYPDSISTGTVAAGGTLGILIPPSIALSIYGVLTEQDIGKLFIAGIVPGLIAMVFYLIAVAAYFTISKPDVTLQERASWSKRLHALGGIWAIVILFLFVIGGIYGGFFTPTEAAAMGACGAILLSLFRGKLNLRGLLDSLIESVTVSAGILLILIGAHIFGYFLTITQSPQKIAALLLGLELGRWGTMLLIVAFLLLLGCILDTMAMIVLMIPILFPVVMQLGFDPIWFGVIFVMAVELGMITPPIGINAFIIRAMVPDVPVQTIFRGIFPFIVVDILRLLLVFFVPALALFLPNSMN
ncbi:TRAP transporter large permease [Celeribacter indicus]|uniref:TRAP transporter large permease protein n=1 Tax=Celeribacter indicus TaxID=1208324 RepID=A0A0B5DPF4_9RHOB|nr:TRAP transporter large permease [Celeribacter indicus]AJE45059.1 TRAP C4-dicarboxylate transporter permease DctM [Celeribacter indicus]SDX42325.1 TRAP transporter, DctM subunit [Celeribacter indicus]